MGTHPIFESDFDCLTGKMDDPVSQLASYRLQLGQVEAALTGEPDNAELLALKVDLDEIITITSELVEETNNKLNYRVGLTIQAPYEKKMYEAISPSWTRRPEPPR